MNVRQQPADDDFITVNLSSLRKFFNVPVIHVRYFRKQKNHARSNVFHHRRLCLPKDPFVHYDEYMLARSMSLGSFSFSFFSRAAWKIISLNCSQFLLLQFLFPAPQEKLTMGACLYKIFSIISFHMDFFMKISHVHRVCVGWSLGWARAKNARNFQLNFRWFVEVWSWEYAFVIVECRPEFE